MGIFSRVTDIVNSNIVHMLDKAENPEKMIRLMIQEMEDTLVEIKSQTAKIIADKKYLQRQINTLSEDSEKWQQKAELAVAKNRDDLARLALEEKSKKNSLKEDLIRELTGVEQSLGKYREDIQTLEEKLNDAKKRQKSIILRNQTAKSQLNVRQKLKRMDSHKAFNKFEALERRIDLMEGAVEAHDIKAANLDDQFAQLENESQINQELEELKKKINKAGDKK